MAFWVLKNESNETILQKLKVADDMWSRMIGLMGKKYLSDMDGLWITPCNSIHTFFMKMAIDVIFLSNDQTVVAVYKSIKPWRMTRIVWRASSVIEAKANTIADMIKIGDKLRMEKCIN
jgi:uncharacterized membrane protein (UPF0127 family)